MKIAVIGAGIVGITTAYELSTDGHDVVVFERLGAAAEAGSFANAGVIAPGYVTPWAAPGMRWQILSHLLRRHAPVRLAWPMGGSDLLWTWRWLRACNAQAYQRHRQALLMLASYSRQRLHALVHARQLEFERSQGYTVLLRSERDWQRQRRMLTLLREAGIQVQELDAVQTRLREPALNPDTPLAGGLHLPDDEVGNCRQFALLLKGLAQQAGARFRFHSAVRALRPGSPAELVHGEGTERFDAVIVCAAMGALDLLRPLGLVLPMTAIYGYSVSAPMREALYAPRSGVMDERYKVAITRLGRRVRVAGGAEVGGHPTRHRPAALATLYKVLRDWYPAAAQLSSGVQEWRGARAMMPHRPPMVGPSPLPGVWLNLGHGSSGWALSCGSARAIADRLVNRDPNLDMAPFAYDPTLTPSG